MCEYMILCVCVCSKERASASISEMSVIRKKNTRTRQSEIAVNIRIPLFDTKCSYGHVRVSVCESEFELIVSCGAQQQLSSMLQKANRGASYLTVFFYNNMPFSRADIYRLFWLLHIR